MRRLIYQFLVLLCIALVPAVASGLWHPRRPAWHAEILAEGEVTLATVQQWPEPVLWIDARDPNSYEASHAHGAYSLNEDDWEALLPDVLMAWRLGMRIVVYCDSWACRASSEVADRLRDEMQWEDVYTLKGGWVVLSEIAP